MKATIFGFIADESGATAIEYSLIAVLISIAVITGASLMGTRLGEAFNNIAGELESSATPDADGG